MTDSQAWTGRPYYAGSPLDLLLWRVQAFLYPTFDCNQCVGQEPHQGCYCAHYDAVAPCSAPEPWRVLGRKLFQGALT